MLQTEHAATPYEKPTFSRTLPARRSFRQVLDRVAAVEVVPASNGISLTDSNAAGIDQLLRQHESVRHDLMLRRVRGETLSPVEEAVLNFLNSELEAHLPRPEQRPADVTAAVQEAKLLLAELENADD